MSSEATPEYKDKVYLLLGKGEGDLFCLEIPMTDIDKLTLAPCKYLLYLGWCILGLNVGHESLSLGLAGDDKEFHEIDSNGDLESDEFYTVLIDGVCPSESLDMAVVDLEVIKTRTAVPSETTGTRIGFREQVLERDIRCVFSGLRAAGGDSLHIIPHKRGSDWLKLIIQNRPHEVDDDIEGLDDINDVRNGFFAQKTMHPYFEARQVVILKTPNRILETDDIPPNPSTRILNVAVDYPENSRYTAQWLDSESDPHEELEEQLLPNNSDAAFGIYSGAGKPSALLLHYNYGAAAVKRWGRKTHILEDMAKEFRPRKPDPAQSGPSKHDRSIAIMQCQKASLSAAKGAKITDTSKGKSTAAWEEDDVMLFFWGNSRVATERYLKMHEAETERVEKWRQGVA